MRSNRFDRLAIGIVLLLGIFALEFAAPLGGLSYLLLGIYILRFTGERETVVILGVVATIAIVVGFFLPMDLNSLMNLSGLSPLSITSRLTCIAAVWICVFVNFRFRELVRKTEDKNDD